MVNIVRAHHCPGEFLHEVILFIRAFGGGEEGEGIGAVFRGNLLETTCHQIERLLPGGLAESRRISSFGGGRHPRPTVPDEGAQEPVRAVDEIHAETALHTQPAVVHRILFITTGADYAVVFDGEHDAAAAATVGADSAHLAELPFSSLADTGMFHQRAGGTDLDAVSAEGAGALL